VEIYLAFIGPVQAFDGANRNCIAQYIVECDPNKWDGKYTGTDIAKNKKKEFYFYHEDFVATAFQYIVVL
jgi:hypothetical protein